MSATFTPISSAKNTNVPDETVWVSMGWGRALKIMQYAGLDTEEAEREAYTIISHERMEGAHSALCNVLLNTTTNDEVFMNLATQAANVFHYAAKNRFDVIVC